jgi:hypothetical protein
MKNKKGSKELSTKKLITIILVAVVVILIVLASVSLDVRGFFKNLPDFFNRTGSPSDLTEEAVVYGRDVTILLNDDYGRCIVVETEPQDVWLKNYGVRGWDLYTKQGDEWKYYDTKMDRVTSDQSKEPMGSQIRMQVIRQGLVEACYLDENDFKDTEILGKKVKLLLNDENGKCIIYESKEQASLEHYGVKKIGSEVHFYWLDSDGIWKEVNLSGTKIRIALINECF